MRLFPRSDARSRYVILPLDDPQLARHARQWADFAAQHAGKGHVLYKARTRKKGQTIICSCSVSPGKERPNAVRLALMEDEIIDDG